MRSKLAFGGLAIAVAFLLVTNPVVVDAAGQITGKQIKNSSIKSNDVKNNTLTGADIKESTLIGTNAATVNGLAPSSYLNSVIRVPVNATASGSGFIKPLPTTIPNGTYLVTINVTAALSAVQTGFFCSLYPFPIGPARALMASFGSNYGDGSASSINAAKVVTVTGPLALFCASAGGTFSTPISNYNDSEITFTKLDTATTTSPVARSSEGGPVPGLRPRP